MPDKNAEQTTQSTQQAQSVPQPKDAAQPAVSVPNPPPTIPGSPNNPPTAQGQPANAPGVPAVPPVIPPPPPPPPAPVPVPKAEKITPKVDYLSKTVDYPQLLNGMKKYMVSGPPISQWRVIKRDLKDGSISFDPEGIFSRQGTTDWYGLVLWLNADPRLAELKKGFPESPKEKRAEIEFLVIGNGLNEWVNAADGTVDVA